MKPYLIFPILIVWSLTAASAPAATDAPVPALPAAAPCDSVSDSPVAGEMLLFNVSVEGGGNTANVSVNDSFTVAFDYYIQVCDSPAANNFCQVVVGFAGAPTPLFCVFRGRVDCNGQLGSLSFRMKAPAVPSEYLVAFDLRRTLTEPACPTTWPQGTPVQARYIACINVTSGNLPVPVTGSANNVTAGSATLNGTVHPAGSPTTVRFLYGLNPGAYTDSVTAAESPVSGSSTFAVSGSLTGLTANRRYYYRAAAESENGYNRGAEASFFTGPLFVLPTPTHSFGHLPVNGERTDSITVVNEGNMTLQISSVIALGGQYSVTPLAATIGVNASRKFAVTFSPPAYGRYNSGIVFVHNGGTTPDTQLVRGDVPIGGVSSGWNIVSVPLTVADPRKTAVFPDAISNAFEFSAGYVGRDSVRNGVGYWLKFPATDSLVVAGDVRNTEVATVVPGWNMVGGPSLAVPLDSVVTTPPGILAGNFFEYFSGYASVPVLRPGKGYWVKVNQAGTLQFKGVLPGGSTAVAGARQPAPEGMATLTLLDASGSSATLFLGPGGPAAVEGSSAELPPPPPEGAFDARFDGDLHSLSLLPGSGRLGSLRISGARYPVTISWTAGAGGAILEAAGIPNPMELPGSVTLRRPSPVVFRAAPPVSGGPDAGRTRSGFAGNHPNPFNPSTVITFTMASPGQVRLTVFNALGEEVSVLLDGVRGAGEHSVVFDAAGLPGGVYFCRMQGGGPPSTLKLLLVK